MKPVWMRSGHVHALGRHACNCFRVLGRDSRHATSSFDSSSSLFPSDVPYYDGAFGNLDETSVVGHRALRAIDVGRSMTCFIFRCDIVVALPMTSDDTTARPVCIRQPCVYETGVRAIRTCGYTRLTCVQSMSGVREGFPTCYVVFRFVISSSLFP